MKNTIWIIGGIALFISFVVYTSFQESYTKGASVNTEEAASKANLTNGETIQLTAEESALEVKANEKKIILSGLGMTCSSCKAAVSAGLKSEKEISSFYVNLGEDRATVVFNPDQINIESIKQAVADVGYEVSEVKEVE